MTSKNNMYGMVGMYGMVSMMNVPGNIISPVKNIVHMSNCILYPPNPRDPPPTTTVQKPLGCKTVFVSGLPEHTTEEIIREVFERCGEIKKVRMCEKYFSYIKFDNELSVENALLLSGWRIKIENKDKIPFTGKLFVCYAASTKDDCMCNIEIYRKTIQCCVCSEKEYCEPVALPSVPPFTAAEAAIISEKLQHNDTFFEAACILSGWVNNGEFNEETNEYFNTLFQIFDHHLEHSISEPHKSEKDLNKVNDKWQKASDDFAKAEKACKEVWEKEIKGLLNECSEVEMNTKHDRNGTMKSQIEQQISKIKQSINELTKVNERLHCELKFSLHERMMLAKRLQARHNEEHGEIFFQNRNNVVNELTDRKKRKLDVDFSSNDTQRYARLIALISIFLFVHPMGANLDYICSYLAQFDGTIKTRDIEDFMKRYPTVFKEETTGIGATLKIVWKSFFNQDSFLREKKI